MKNAIFFSLATLLLSASASAQTTDSTATTVGTATTTAKVEIPAHLQGVTSDNIKPEHYLPVLGSFQSADAKAVTVTVDPANVGIVWIDGLSQGRVKAYLKKSPATYKIPAQKTAEGKSVAGGTLFFDPATKQVSIFIGREYNDENPLTVFEATSKAKGQLFTGTKVETATTTGIQVN